MQLQAATIFVSDESGRLLTTNSPDRVRAPRLYLARCGQGAILRLRDDAGPAAGFARLAADEPPLASPAEPARFVDKYVALLSRSAPVERVEAGLMWTFPASVPAPRGGHLVRSATAPGDALVGRLNADGMPSDMVKMGFVDTREFWPPWCVALVGDEVASIAFTTGHSEEAAEIGVATMPRFRGRGFAALAAAGWASHEILAGKTLFYSTSLANRSSQRVVERLGLRFLGTSLRIS